MKENFRSALDFVMTHECVFEPGHYGDYAHVMSENVKGDRGGLTKFGIDQRSHPNIDIRALDYLGAARIYRDGEWTKCRCDELPTGFDVAVFDCAVNCGCGTAAKMLQKACNIAGAEPALKEDGFIGAKTIAACGRTPNALPRFLILREVRYRDLAAHDHEKKQFLNGWLNRLVDLEIAVNRMTDFRGTTEEVVA